MLSPDGCGTEDTKKIFVLFVYPVYIILLGLLFWREKFLTHPALGIDGVTVLDWYVIVLFFHVSRTSRTYR